MKPVIHHLLGTYGQSKSIWAGIALSATSHIASKILVPLVLAKWVSVIVVSRDPTIVGLVQVAALYIVALLCGFVGDYIFVKRSDEQYEKLVGNFYDAIVCKDVALFRGEEAGSLAARFRNFLDGTINLFRLLRTEIIPLLVSIAGSVIVLCAFNLWVAIVFSVAALLRSYVSWLAVSKIDPFRRNSSAAYNRLSGAMGDQMAHLPVVRASANYDANRKLITNAASEEARLFWIRHRNSAVYDLVGHVLVAICFLVILSVVAYSQQAGMERIELAILAIIFVIQGMQAAQGVGELQQRWNERWEHVATSLGEFPLQTFIRSDGVNLVAPSSGSVEFAKVVFSYGDDLGNKVLNEVDLKIQDGQHVAVVGANGAGKSTLVNLLMRFDRPQSGQVLLSERPIEDWEEEPFYRALAYVPQEPKLFNRSVIDNLMFYEPHAPQQRIDQVSTILKIGELEALLPGGLATSAGEMGNKLSGGQRQIVAIARALLRDAKIYIFDEATSALQHQRAQEVVREIRAFLSNRTVIFVTHSAEVARMFPVIIDVADRQIYMREAHL